MEDNQIHVIKESYDRVADEYTRQFFFDLGKKPLDCKMLTRFAAETNCKGRVCDMACGPGHVARFLQQAGADVFGLDLSPGMLAEARRLNPQIEFREGNMLDLDLADESLAGIVAFYPIVNLPRKVYGEVFREMARVLKPRGLLLLSHHIGTETLHRNKWWDRRVNMDFHFLNPLAVRRDLERAGLAIEQIVEREPYEIEYQCRRAYIFALKPAD